MKLIVVGLAGLAAVGTWVVWQDDPVKEATVTNSMNSDATRYQDSPSVLLSGGNSNPFGLPFSSDKRRSTLPEASNVSPVPVVERMEPLRLQIMYEYDTLVKRPLAEIWVEWPTMFAKLDERILDSYITGIGHNLRRSGQPSDYAWIESQLRDPSLPLEERMAHVHLLEEAATPEATRILLDYLAWSHHEPALAESAIRSISEISRTTMDESRNANVSPVLEEAWNNSTPEMPPRTLAVLASSIAYLGTPDGVSALIGAVQELPADALPDQRSATALNAIAEISGPDAVPPLTKALSEPSSTDLFWSGAVGLLTIGNADAYWAVIPRLQTVRQISDEDFEAISYAVTGRRGISPEAEKVLLDLTRTQGFADARLGELFSTPRE